MRNRKPPREVSPAPRILGHLACQARLAYRWILLAAALLFGCCLLLVSPPTTAGATATLYVYAVTPLRARALEQEIEDSMPGVDVTVFGKLSDFKTALEATPPSAALSPKPVLASLNRTADLQGVKAGSDAEQFLLVSTKALTTDMLSSSSTGSSTWSNEKRFQSSSLGSSV